MMNSKMSASALILNTAKEVVTFISFILWCIPYSLFNTIQEVYSFFRLVFHLLLHPRLHLWKRSSHDGSPASEPQPDMINITSNDVGIVMNQLGMPHQEPFSQDSVESIASMFDKIAPSLDEVGEAFRIFDEDNDGFVDAGELKRVMSSLGLVGFSGEECERMIMVFDDDGDGRISFGEFVKLVEENVCF